MVVFRWGVVVRYEMAQSLEENECFFSKKTSVYSSDVL